MANCCRHERGHEPNSLLSSSMNETFGNAANSSSLQDNDDLFVKEMNALSVEERTRLYEEIHGVADVVEETAGMLEANVRRMKEELAKVAQRRRAALDRAIFLRPGIITDEKLHLMFLRAERFNPQLAAQKMCRFFDHKMELFGDERLAKKITLDDLGDAELRHVFDGAMQFMTVNANGQLALYFKMDAVSDIREWKPMARYMWYQLQAVLEDENIQKRGIVEVANTCGKWKFNITQLSTLMRQVRHFLNDRPVRICGYHFLSDQASLGPFYNSMKNHLFKKELRLRGRFHFGSNMELKYALMSYGIRLSGCFELDEKMFSPAHIESYLESRREKEAEIERFEKEKLDGKRECSFYPCPHDILMGRGRAAFKWHGNTRLAVIVSDRAKEYTMAARQGKSEIVAEIVDQVRHNQGARFLQRSATGWQMVGDLASNQKVRQLLRDASSKNQSTKDNVEDQAEQNRTQVEAENLQEGLPKAEGSSKRPRIL